MLPFIFIWIDIRLMACFTFRWFVLIGVMAETTGVKGVMTSVCGHQELCTMHAFWQAACTSWSLHSWVMFCPQVYWHPICWMESTAWHNILPCFMDPGIFRHACPSLPLILTFSCGSTCVCMRKVMSILMSWLCDVHILNSLSHSGWYYIWCMLFLFRMLMPQWLGKWSHQSCGTHGTSQSSLLCWHCSTMQQTMH